MGKKARSDRAEKRESYASQRSRKGRKNILIAAGVLGTVAVIVGYSAFVFVTSSPSAMGAPPGAGAFGDEHVHASILVSIFGQPFDFSLPTYQIKNSWIHFEAQDGTTIHRHASGVTLGYLFETLGIGLDNECYLFRDGRDFCTNDEFSLRFFVNGEEVPGITDYVFEDQDRILVAYGDESDEGIKELQDELELQPIFG